MPTFRVMDSEGRLVDAAAPAPDIADEELVKLYMDMLTGAYFAQHRRQGIVYLGPRLITFFG